MVWFSYRVRSVPALKSEIASQVKKKAEFQIFDGIFNFPFFYYILLSAFLNGLLSNMMEMIENSVSVMLQPSSDEYDTWGRFLGILCRIHLESCLN